MRRQPPAPAPPKRCLCGCGRALGPRARKFATPLCHFTPEARRQYGREGGKTRAANYNGRLVDALAALSRRDAILEAYARGRRAGYEARDRAIAR